MGWSWRVGVRFFRCFAPVARLGVSCVCSMVGDYDEAAIWFYPD